MIKTFFRQVKNGVKLSIKASKNIYSVFKKVVFKPKQVVKVATCLTILSLPVTYPYILPYAPMAVYSLYCNRKYVFLAYSGYKAITHPLTQIILLPAVEKIICKPEENK